MKGMPSGFTHTEDAYGVSSYVLDSNGLEVLIQPRSDGPVVGTMVTYRVGSRHEQAGHTGATHILEHVMFKGSVHFDPKKGRGIWQLLEKKGAQGNATTWCDRTNYYWISPSHLFKDALHIEADRMRNLLLRPEDLASEMTVVRNEYESGENDPYHRLAKAAWLEAFTLHPYRIPTIGTKEDIEGVTTEKLKKFYDAFYWPNNATVTIIGDTDVPSALSCVKDAFGAIPKSPIHEPPYEKEPEQAGERRLELKRKGTVNALLFCFKAPAGRADDSVALSALGTLLGGGKSSLLHRALVDTGIAVDVAVEYPRFRDPSVLEIYVSLSENGGHKKAEETVMRIIGEITSRGAQKEDVLRAKNYSASGKLFAMSSAYGVLTAVNEAIALGDWKDAYSRIEKIRGLAPDDITAAARAYLSRERLTLGSLFAV